MEEAIANLGPTFVAIFLAIDRILAINLNKKDYFKTLRLFFNRLPVVEPIHYLHTIDSATALPR